MDKAGIDRLPARVYVCGLLLLSSIAGCDGRDPVDTPVNWWHQLEGGEIAQQRPPPPGVDDPYPKVGTTPARPPVLPSPQLRASLTETLIEQRNLSARLNAIQPLPPPATPAVGTPAKPGTKPAPTATTGTPAAAPPSSATLDAAEAPPAPALPVPAAPSRPAADPTPDLPAIAPDQAGEGPASGPIPAIAQAPPAAPTLPGIVMPPPPSYVPPSHPDYALGPAHGEILQFPPGSDQLSPGQDGTIRELADKRGKAGTLYVHGYGEAGSDAPLDQAQALTLASLRAQSVAEALQHHGVPASAIRLRADAFGRGASAGLVD